MPTNKKKLEKINVNTPQLIIHGEMVENVEFNQKENESTFEITVSFPPTLSYSLFRFYPKGNEYEIHYNEFVIRKSSFVKFIRVDKNSIKKTFVSSSNIILISGELFHYNPLILE
jgi:hypothetical protein